MTAERARAAGEAAGVIGGHQGAAAVAPLRCFGSYRQFGRHGPVSAGPLDYLASWPRGSVSGEGERVVNEEVVGGAVSWSTIELPDFDRRVLGRSIARIRDVFSPGSADLPPELARQVRSTVESLRRRGVGILMADAWASDAPFGTACTEAGMTAGATKLRWIRPRLPARTVDRLRGRHAVRAARASDLESLLPLAGQFGPGQYAGVCGISAEDIAQFYSHWMAQAWRGNFADGVLVADNSTGPCAFASFKLRRDLLQATGRRIMGGGLAAVARGSEGALIALMAAMMARVDAGDYDGVEFDMYEGNSAASRCLSAFDFRHVDTARVMHCCLEKRTAAAGAGE